jgi:hypothetical protein
MTQAIISQKKTTTRPAPVVSNRPPAAVPALARHARTPPTPLARTLFRVLSLSQQTHIKIVSARPQRGDGGGSKFWGAPWASRFARARPHSYPNSRPSIGDLPSLPICHLPFAITTAAMSATSRHHGWPFNLQWPAMASDSAVEHGATRALYLSSHSLSRALCLYCLLLPLLLFTWKTLATSN